MGGKAGPGENDCEAGPGEKECGAGPGEKECGAWPGERENMAGPGERNKAGPGEMEAEAGPGYKGETGLGELEGKAGPGDDDGKAGQVEKEGGARPGEEGEATVRGREALLTLSFFTMTETLLQLGFSVRRAGRGTSAVVRPDSKVTLAFKRSGLLGLCNNFISALPRTLLVKLITPPPACRSSPRGTAGATTFLTWGRTFTDLTGLAGRMGAGAATGRTPRKTGFEDNSAG